MRGGARAFAVVALVAAALAAAGCGAETHPNEQRPAVATRVSVVINPNTILVQRGDIGSGEERDQQIPQNQDHKQPRIKTDAPLSVTFVTANQTGTPSKVVIKGAKELTSVPVPARSPATFSAELPAGNYTVTAPGVPGATPAHFTVGNFRASSENDVLLP